MSAPRYNKPSRSLKQAALRAARPAAVRSSAGANINSIGSGGDSSGGEEVDLSDFYTIEQVDTLLESVDASVAIGDAIESGTATRVLFLGAGGVLSQDDGLLFDSINDRLTVGAGSSGVGPRLVFNNHADISPRIDFNTTNDGLGLRIYCGGVEHWRFQSNGVLCGTGFGVGIVLGGGVGLIDGSAHLDLSRVNTGKIRINGASGATEPAIILGHTQGTADNLCITFVSSISAGVICGIDQGVSGQTGNLREWRNNLGVVLSSISENGYFMTRRNAAPVDGELAAGEMGVWFDSTDGAGKLKVKAKTANGTVVTGELPLI